AEGVYMDEALNVILPLGDTGENPLVVFAAHSDVVFPDTEALPLRVEDGRIHCPGVCDDTANVVAMFMAICPALPIPLVISFPLLLCI
ncbi:MAG: M20/M25/M40 family metallo-hydrolase, partial [Bacteroidaceae bacterium]|nr:M20/M25/M40 family metallo-hydrolase [Bacteroidaceae bacterium]